MGAMGLGGSPTQAALGGGTGALPVPDIGLLEILLGEEPVCVAVPERCTVGCAEAECEVIDGAAECIGAGAAAWTGADGAATAEPAC